MKNDLKLLIADIDGTLVNEARDMLPITRAVLNDLHKRGVMLGIRSSIARTASVCTERWMGT